MFRRALIAAVSLPLLGGCPDKPTPESRAPRSAPSITTERPKEQPSEAVGEDGEPADLTGQHEALIATLAEQGIEDERVLKALRSVPRHELLPQDLWGMAYADRPLPIGEGQTISQPHIVALMTQLADLDEGDKVLEVGTGSGYQAAVLAEVAGEVYTIEIVEPLAKRARADLERLGYADDIHFRVGDGYAGWPDAAPFDAIVVTAAPPSIPEPLKRQLAVGGRMVIPVGEYRQELMLLERTEEGIEEKDVIPVLFVPMTGKAQD